MEPIHSLQNAKIKLAHALQSRAKSRRKEGKIALEGVRLVRDAWHNHITPHFILYTPNTNNALIDELIADDVLCLPVSEQVMQHISDTQSPQGILGVFDMPHPTLPQHPKRLLILDAITDPGNMGTLIRTASGAGVDAVLLMSGSVDPYNPKVLRSAMGAHFRVAVLESTWEALAALSLDAIYLADGQAQTRYDHANWTQSWALIIGSEAHGVSDNAQQIATTPLYIPMTNQTESLNAAIAAAVMLFEAVRQNMA